MNTWALCITCLAIITAPNRGRIRTYLTKLLSAILSFYLHWKYPIRDVSGKMTIPSLPYTWPNGTGDTEKFINGPRNSQIWRDKYGSIYRLWAGSTPEVVVCDPVHLKEVFFDSNRHSKAKNNDSGYLMSQILGQCVGLLSPPEWKAVRTKLEHPFTHRSIENSSSMIMRVTEQYFKELFQSEVFRKGALDPIKDLEFYPFLITATLIYGELSETHIHKLKEIMPLRSELFTHVFKGGLARFEIGKYFPTRFNRLLRQFQTQWKEFNNSVYHEKRSRGEDVPIVSFWDQMLAGHLPQVQLLQTLDEALFANLDVTSSAMAWNLVFLATYPDVQARLYGEITTRVQDKANTLTEYIRDNDTYLAACTQETARHRPIVAFSMPQAPPTDRKVGEWILPKNTMVIVDTFAVNMRDEFWGEDASDYRPSRFLEIKGKVTRYQWWQYGLGPRQCMGKYLADHMLRALLFHVVRTFRLELPEKESSQRMLDDGMTTWVRTPQTKLHCRFRRLQGGSVPA